MKRCSTKCLLFLAVIYFCVVSADQRTTEAEKTTDIHGAAYIER